MRGPQADAAESVALARLARAFDEELLSRTAAEMVEAMSSGIEQVRADHEIGGALLAASRETASRFVSSLELDPWIVPPLPPALSELARVFARNGAELTVLITATRYGQAAFWPVVMHIAEQAIDKPAVRMRVLAVAFERFGRYLETELEAAVAIFQDERDLRMRGAHVRRRETIEALIRGEELNVDSASRALGYELRWLHTGLALWSREPGPETLDRLESVAREIASALGIHRILMTPSGTAAVWAWLATDRPPAREPLAAVNVASGVSVAVGQATSGIAGFRTTHEEALAAREISIRGGDGAPLTWYADVEIVSLLTHGQRGADALVARELAGLAGQDSGSAKLRRTALAFLQCAGSATAAARELGVHTNTVRYRIEQTEQLLGRTLIGQELPLQLALMLAELGPEPRRGARG
ncbi:MAG: PucR family transcriptional regulator [Solirubrobacteraceae bacterium]